MKIFYYLIADQKVCNISNHKRVLIALRAHSRTVQINIFLRFCVKSGEALICYNYPQYYSCDNCINEVIKTPEQVRTGSNPAGKTKRIFADKLFKVEEHFVALKNIQISKSLPPPH